MNETFPMRCEGRGTNIINVLLLFEPSTCVHRGVLRVHRQFDLFADFATPVCLS